MNNIFVYCEVTEECVIADVSLELLSKARKLADELNCQVEAIVVGNEVKVDLEATLSDFASLPISQDRNFYLYLGWIL